MSDSYVSDNYELKLESSELFLLLTESFAFFKKDNMDIAREIMYSSRSCQQTLIYEVLDLKYKNSDGDEDYLLEANLFGSLPQIIRRSVQAIKREFSNESPERLFLMGVLEKNYDNCNSSCTSHLDIARVPTNILIDLLYKDIDNYRFSKELARIFNNKYVNFANLSKCLRYCYLDYMTTIYAEGVYHFQVCSSKLKGQDIRISTYSDVLKNYPIDSACNEIYTAILELYKEIDQMLTIIYKRDTLLKKKWIDTIFLKLRAIEKNQVYRVNFSTFDDSFDSRNNIDII